jgi:hypothetical protein
METKIAKTKFSLSKDGWPQNSLLQTFEISALIEKIKLSRSWKDGELNSTVLLRSSSREIVLTALHEGTEIVSFQSDDPVTIQVIEGRLEFQSRHESGTLYKDQHLNITERIKFCLTSMEETVFLLTILKGPCSLSESRTGVN